MPPLNTKRWEKFLIGDLFDIEIGKAVDGNKVDKISGHYAYITRKENTNGLDGFIDYDEKFLNAKFPVITVGNETAQPYVQTFPFFTGTKVNILSPKISLSRFALMFIAQSLRVHKEKYSYSFTINSTRLRKQPILLPVTDDGKPDFDYMETYIAAHEEKILQRYRDYVQTVDAAQILPLSEKTWREFFISDVTDIISGRDIYEDEREAGNNPYIGASANNNGVCHFVSNENETLESNCISVNRNGSVGYAFFHPYAALYSNDCRKLRPHVKNEFVSIFIAQQVTAQRGKYNYGYKMGTARLKRQKILLPVTDDGTPDFDYMAAFTRNKFAEIVRRYLEVDNVTFDSAAQL